MGNPISFAQLVRGLSWPAVTSAALLAAPAAQAQVAAAGMMLPASAAALVTVSCDFSAVQAQAEIAAVNTPPRSKAGALSGGGDTLSALERMVQAQAGQAPAEATLAQVPAAPAASLSAAEASPFGLSHCPGQLPETVSQAYPLADPLAAAPQTDFLASKRIRIGATSFEADWRRVKNGRVSANWAKRKLGTSARNDEQLLQAVNAFANRTIRYAEDRDLWGKRDYWANAKTTFRLGKGDCEDIAIAKMQMLAAMGIKREDMVLTLAKDLIRRADHAVLIVRLDGRFVMLDNTTDKLVDASVSQGYRPILSFGNDQSWLHGF